LVFINKASTINSVCGKLSVAHLVVCGFVHDAKSEEKVLASFTASLLLENAKRL
jgi:hypothetical protein